MRRPLLLRLTPPLLLLLLALPAARSMHAPASLNKPSSSGDETAAVAADGDDDSMEGAPQLLTDQLAACTTNRPALNFDCFRERIKSLTTRVKHGSMNMEHLKGALTQAEDECRMPATVVLAKADRLKLVQETLDGETVPSFFLVRLDENLEVAERVPLSDIEVPTQKDNYNRAVDGFRNYGCDAVKIGEQQKGGLELVLKRRTIDEVERQFGELVERTFTSFLPSRPFKRIRDGHKALNDECTNDLQCASGFCWKTHAASKRKCRCVAAAQDGDDPKHKCVDIKIDQVEGQHCHRDWQCLDQLFCVSNEPPNKVSAGKQFKPGKCRTAPDVGKDGKDKRKKEKNGRYDKWNELRLNCKDVTAGMLGQTEDELTDASLNEKQKDSQYCVVRSTWLSRVGTNWKNALWRDFNFEGLWPVNYNKYFMTKAHLDRESGAEKIQAEASESKDHVRAAIMRSLKHLDKAGKWKQFLTLKSGYLSQEKGKLAPRNYEMRNFLGAHNWFRGFFKNLGMSKETLDEELGKVEFKAAPGDGLNWLEADGGGVNDANSTTAPPKSSELGFCQPCYERLCSFARKINAAKANRKYAAETARFNKYMTDVDVAAAVSVSLTDRMLDEDKNKEYTKAVAKADIQQGLNAAASLAEKSRGSKRRKEYMDMAIKFTSCAAGIGLSAASMGVTAGVAATGCITFLSTAAKHVVKSFKDAVVVIPDPPLFANELEWTKEYVEAVEMKLLDEARVAAKQKSPHEAARQKIEQVLAETTLRQLICVIKRMQDYTTDPGNRGGASEQGFTKLADVEKYRKMELEATETLRELQRKMLTILQVKLVDTTNLIRDKTDDLLHLRPDSAKRRN